MKLYDLSTEHAYTLPELRAEWMVFRSAEPWNHADDFRTELFEIIMATVNGRNDCDVVGLTPDELRRFTAKLRKVVGA